MNRPVVTWGMIDQINEWVAKWQGLTFAEKRQREQFVIRNGPHEGDARFVLDSMVSTPKSVL